jgi:hypothetical protein
MINSNLTPGTIGWRKWFKFAFMDTSKVVKFFVDAYQLEDDVKSHRKANKETTFPSVGRRA